MSQTCYICDSEDGVTQKGKNLKSVLSILNDILDKTITDDVAKSKAICQICQSTCLEYEKIKQRLKTIKDDLKTKFKKTNGDDTSTVKTPIKRVVLPASKLQPLPMDHALNKLPRITKISPIKQPVIKILGSTYSDQATLTKIASSNTSSVTSAKNLFSVAGRDTVTNNASSSLGAKSMPSIEFVSTNIDMKIEEKDDDNNSENKMEADLGFSVQVLKEKIDDESEVMEGDRTEENDDEYSEELVLGELEVLSDNEENDSSTGGGTKVRLVRGRKLVYNVDELGLIDGAADGNNESADESQIELQLSGDEETANAIIKAAQEEGGAFIKVETGEMFRVKSVQSAVEESQNIMEKVGDKFKCLLCADNNKSDAEPTLYDANGGMKHARDSHMARVYICARCGAIMYRRHQYTAHLATHSGSARNPKRLHAAVAAANTTHRCGFCGKTFASKYTHLAHLKTHQERPRPFKCVQCPKSFLTQQNLNQHAKTHTGVKDFICKTCDKAFGSQHNLEMHSVVHSGQKPFACTSCPKRFARRAELLDHNRTHTGERPFECGECGARFAQRSNLHSHRRAAHLHDARHACELCPKRFKRRRLLDYHMKSCHTGERPLRCDVCHATFVYPEHYKKHMRIHSGERPYPCEVCGKTFNSRDIRNTHRFVHSDKKPYECLVCGQGFMRRPLLYSHMNSAGHLAESIVVNQPRVHKVTKTVITTEPTVQIKTNKFDALFQPSQGVQLISSETNSDVATAASGDDGPKLFITSDKKIVFQDGKSTSTIISEDTDIEQIDGTSKDVNALLQSLTAEQLTNGAQVVYTDGDNPPQEGGNFVRMLPIKLDNGDDGWLAIAE